MPVMDRMGKAIHSSTKLLFEKTHEKPLKIHLQRGVSFSYKARGNMPAVAYSLGGA